MFIYVYLFIDHDYYHILGILGGSISHRHMKMIFELF